MSTTTDIVCTSCKERLWIGQSDYIYINVPTTMKHLNEFLQKHRTGVDGLEHNLLFVSEHWEPMYDEGWKKYE